MESRRAFGDFAMRLTLPVCDGQQQLGIRGIHGGLLDLEGNQAWLYNNGTERGEPVSLAKSLQRTIYISGLGNHVAVTIDETPIGNFASSDLGDRGKLTITSSLCDGKPLEITDLSWADARQKSSEPLFYQTLETPPAPVLSPQQALQRFSLAPGFEIELVAAEPLVEDPVAMAWDAQGRLYVVEMRGFMPTAYGEGQDQPVGRIVRLEDTDKDGQMDTSTVYLDQLVLPRAVAVVNEGVLVGEPPNLWLCQHNNPEETCDKKTRLTHYAAEGDIEHTENGLMLALDNWIYNAKSSRRMQLRNGELVEEETLLRGQWGITQDNEGRLYYNHNSRFAMADLFPAENLGPGTIPAQGLGSSISLDEDGSEEVFSIRVNPGVNRAYLEGTLKADGRLASPTAVSGLEVYRGDQFPVAYRQDIFIPEPGANVVAQFRPQQVGMELNTRHITYPDEQWQLREFLASTDERFRPVDTKNGPDGALYIIDMYRGIIQEQNYMTDELREQVFERGLDEPLGMGRIWRIKHSDNAIPASLPDLNNASPTDLVRALQSDNGWRRDTAQRLLLKQPASVSALTQLLEDSHSPAALHAIWILKYHNVLDRNMLNKALSSTSPALQIQALRSGNGILQIDDLLALANQTELTPRVSHQLIYSLSPYASDIAVQSYLSGQLQQHGDSLLFREAALATTRGQEYPFLLYLLAQQDWLENTETKATILKNLAESSYLSLRGDITSKEPAPEQLNQLLATIEAQQVGQDWRQIALLRGLEAAANRDQFTPAQLPGIPALFADSSINEDNPLWQARLRGRRAFTWPGDEVALGFKPLSPNQMAQVELGKELYIGCASCHSGDGKGIEGLAPPLANSSWVSGPPEWLARIILQGLNGPIEVHGKTWNGVMPAHQDMAGFSDEAVAGLLTYLRRSWGNRADPVAVDIIKAARQDTSAQSMPWTVATLEQVEYDSGLDRYTGKFKLSFLTFTIVEQDHALHLKVPMYGGGVLEQHSETRFGGSAGGETIEIEFDLPDDGGPAKQFTLLRKGERLPVKRIE
jgi:glucose/arabinose dehydrogenase/mono/diheme cytochrome c family protein